MGVPYCFFPTNYGYDVTQEGNTTTGLRFQAKRNGDTPPYIYGGDISTIEIEINFQSKSVVHLKIIDPSAQRYEVPLDTPQGGSNVPPADALYTVTYTKAPFSVQIVRKETGQVIFDNSLGGLVFSDQFLQMSTSLASKSLYGLGEHVSNFLLDTEWQTLTLFARDQGTPTGYTNLYGAHPFYMNLEASGHGNGLFFKNSNAMDVVLQPAPAATFRTIGGVLDFYIIVGDATPMSVPRAYTDIVGKPFMPPYWALGFHLCRWGYDSLDETRRINDGMRSAKIPMDTQWNDIDYMSNHLDFEYDPDSFKGLPEFVDHLHQDYHQRYIMIIDPGISNTQGPGNYPAYDEALAQGLFVNNSDGSIYEGTVWPGLTNFPDFFNPASIPYWTKQLAAYHQQVPFDGVWIDMNEIATTGPSDACPKNKYTAPPFLPGLADDDINQKSFCADTVHFGGPNYNVHSLYGHMEMKATHAAMVSVGKRPFVISRSTFAGSGQWGGHWLGDNTATWNDLRLSIPGVLSFNLFAIPMVGADICGFNGETTVELCSRWMQVGAFYPFSRNHNTIGAHDQDPPSLGPEVSARAAAALRTRYELLPLLYTLFRRASTHGDMVARPLAFEFPLDIDALAVDQQFMWGAQLLVSPATTQGAVSVEAYLPNGTWYDLYTNQAIQGSSKAVTLAAGLDDPVPLHVRAGSIILTRPIGSAGTSDALTTAEADALPFVLRVFLGHKGAQGEAFLDDGVSVSPAASGQLWWHFSATLSSASGKLFFSKGSESKGDEAPHAAITTAVIAGMSSPVGSLQVNGVDHAQFSLDDAVLTVSDLDFTTCLMLDTPCYNVTWST